MTFSIRKTLMRAAAAGLALAALSSVPASAADKVTLGALRFTSHAASFVAYERGYFKEQGLDVEFKFFQAAQPMAVAIASGDVDFGVTAITGGLIGLADKGVVKVIGGALHEEKGIDGQIIIVSNKAYDEGVTDPSKLKGRTFGITQSGSSFHYMAAKIADAEGFTLQDMKVKPMQKVGAVIGALKSGQIDAWSIQPHIAKALIAAGAVKKIGMVADFIPDYQVTTVFTSTKIATENRDLVKRFLAAYSKGAADFNAALVDKTQGADGEKAMAELIHKYVYADQPFEKASKSIINGAMRLNPDARLDLTSVKDQLAWFKAENLAPESITLDKLVDPSFVETY
ncbi:NitT/TauT family transport system substrate-binding protein [Breoghania corrubedonensis]|uniref:NitT/TauT family transport system substrate-binding protein n=1 Tax=Breoghania corrubedonensis TaxID=665038 RepID=A0A2T5V7M7_9HYPH|nr:ABC transporter substrate-binding protein [Breoghania corrubedonensis]PTW59767.1 NitT/TauT family transport system substrate-binding protein [Breoghania corrubedonensis]